MSTEGDGVAERIVRIRALLVAELHDAAFIAGIHRAAEAVVRAPRGSLVTQDLVADVLGDTYTGALTWNPERGPDPRDRVDDGCSCTHAGAGSANRRARSSVHRARQGRCAMLRPMPAGAPPSVSARTLDADESTHDG